MHTCNCLTAHPLLHITVVWKCSWFSLVCYVVITGCSQYIQSEENKLVTQELPVSLCGWKCCYFWYTVGNLSHQGIYLSHDTSVLLIFKQVFVSLHLLLACGSSKWSFSSCVCFWDIGNALCAHCRSVNDG